MFLLGSDENECITGNHDCPHKCENTEGGYTCACPDGYKKQGDDCKGSYSVQIQQK